MIEDSGVLASWQGRRLRQRAVPNGDPEFLVEELDAEGAVTACETFGHGGLFAAIDEYNSRWVGTLDPETARAASIVVEMGNHIGARNIEVLCSLLSDQFVFVDHRGIGYPDLDREGLITATVANAQATSRWLLTTLHAASTGGSVASGGFWSENFGDWAQNTFGVWVNLVEDSQVTRAELFSDDSIDGALERFGQLDPCSPNNT